MVPGRARNVSPQVFAIRRFGLTIGGALTVFGSVSWWRGHELPPLVMWTIAACLVVPALVAPVLLGPVERFWMGPVMRVAQAIGEVVSRVFLGLFFYLVFAPMGLVMRRFRDPLDRSLTDGRSSNWVKRTPQPVDPASYERQF